MNTPEVTATAGEGSSLDGHRALVLVQGPADPVAANSGSSSDGGSQRSAASRRRYTREKWLLVPVVLGLVIIASQRDGGFVGQAGTTIEIAGGLQVQSSPLSPGYSRAHPTLCTTVNLTNSSDRTVGYDLLDWTVRPPTGLVLEANYHGVNLLGSGEMAPGETAGGNVCFEGAQQPGTYEVSYVPAAHDGEDRAVFLNTAA